MDVHARVHPVHPALRGLVTGGYHLGSELLAPGEVIAVPAAPGVSINVNIGAAPAGFPSAYAVGPGHLYHYGARESLPPTRVDWVGLRLSPLGAYVLLGGLVGELGKSVVDLGDLFGPAGRVLADRFRGADSPAAHLAVLDAFLLRRAEAGARPNPEVIRAWHRLTRSGGSAPVAHLAAEAGWSADHFGRVFHRQIGMAPKSAGRLIRLGQLLRHAEPGRSHWPELAAEHGFCDQPHLNRDMREFMGVSPATYFSRLRSCGCLVASAPERRGSDTSKTAAPTRP
ncbi:helix-turn-helix domain-containing protein [Streptomyces aureus]|uniref:helix-turn-helix domain-containing protein n=1 Tax=Streptomyces aureus TaxID=193461 RepID=UPI00068CFB85|nr:helix-turn-helix domain-containing protein [Streptomyces aureus]